MKKPVSIRSRIEEYKDRGFHERKGKFFCKYCNVEVDYQKKSSIDQHIETMMHSNKEKKADIHCALSLTLRMKKMNLFMI